MPGGNRKIGKNKKKPSMQRYKAEGRLDKNKARNKKAEEKRQNEKQQN